jgi:hypothetical protein
MRELEAMIGKRLLVGITYLGDGDEPDELEQFVGVVREVEPLVSIDVEGRSEPFTLPPEPDAYEVAAEGQYRLRRSGEVVVNPDFVTTWTVNPPGSEDE